MVGVDTHFILLQVEGILAGVDGFQLVVAVEVGPPPQAAVKDVGQTFTVGHLKTPIQGPEDIKAVQDQQQICTTAQLDEKGQVKVGRWDLLEEDKWWFSRGHHGLSG